MDPATAPKITFRAGKCDADLSCTPPKVKPVATPGWLYLYSEEDIVHFCWRSRNVPATEPELDLLMFPGDGSFVPYLGQEKQIGESGPKSPVNGRIFVLKFSSSSQRYLFWLQSREQPRGDPSQFSPRDLKLGEMVNKLLQGEELNIASEIESVRRGGSGDFGDDDDTTMEETEDPESRSSRNRRGSRTGGAGAGATGGDIREEGEESREGGADGGRARNDGGPADAAEVVQNFLESLRSQKFQPPIDDSFPTLSDLLHTNSTIAMADSLSETNINELLVHHLPTALLFQSDGDYDADIEEEDLDQETTLGIVESLSLEQKRAILHRVLRSPQFHQSLSSLTSALKDGGLQSISEALQVDAAGDSSTLHNSNRSLTGGLALRAFLEALKKSVQQSDHSKVSDDSSK